MYCNFFGRMYVIVCNVMYKIGEEEKKLKFELKNIYVR